MLLSTRFRSVVLAALPLIAAGALVAQADDPVVSRGETVYKTYCTACHGPYLTGGSARGLIKTEWLRGNTPDALRRTVTEGIAELGMPPWGAALKPEDIAAVVAFVIAQQSAPPRTAQPLPPKIETELVTLATEIVVSEGLKIPWAIEFVDARRALITERIGRLRWLVDGKLDPVPIEGIPLAFQTGGGGLLDLALDPDYARNGWVYLSYSHALPPPRADESMTRISRGRIDGHRWVDHQVVFEAPPAQYFRSQVRFGCRLLFDRGGRLYFSIGDRGRANDCQDLTRISGKIFRVNPDGTIPQDNPFVDQPQVLPAIYAYGSRNAQGLAVHPGTGEIWESEHGPQGGDELNLLRPGANYGWPKVTHGIDYDGRPISAFKKQPGIEPPVLDWTPSIAVGAIEFVQSPLFPAWNQHLLAGALRYEELRRLVIENRRVVSQEVLFKGHGRVRDFKFSPDGSLYVLLNQPDHLIRLTPKRARPSSIR